MIITKIYGGLAGQLLQYALGKKLSLKNKTKLFLDTSWYDQPYWNPEYPRDFKLNKLKVSYEILQSNKLVWKIKLTNRLNKINPLYHKVIRETDFREFDSTIFNSGNKIVLDGYWNSYKYFEDIREVLLNEYCPVDKPDYKNELYLNKIKSTNSVSIHFRRGDYKQTDFHGLIPKEYYEEAIYGISQTLDNPILYIFSDEPEWVVQNMNFNLPYEVIDFNRDDNNYWDIELMKNCKHNIIANSGFSWWGAWLNSYPDQMVIAPYKWINQEKGKIDNIPKGWILI